MFAQPLFQVVTALTAALSFIIGTGVLYYGAKRKFSPSLFLGIFFYCLALMTTLDFFVGQLTTTEGDLARVLMNLSTMSMISAVLILLLYTDRITGVTRAISLKTVFGLFLCGITLGIAIEEPWNIITDLNGWIQSWNENFTFFFLIMLFFVFGNFLLTLFSAYKEIENPRQRLIIVIVFWAFIISVGGGSLYVILEEIVTKILPVSFPRLDIYILFLGTTILGITQLLEPLGLYFIPARIDVCGIASDDGVPYVAYVPEGSSFDTTLATAAIAGVQGLIKEVSNAEKRIKSLDSGDKKILFDYLEPKKDLLVIAFLISNAETIALHDTLSHILKKFIKEYEEDLDFVVDVDRFSSFKEKIKKSLSFAMSKATD